MRINQLSKRLYAVAGYVKRGSVVADIGCDHGYLGIYLALKKDAFVYCIDKNKKSLDKAYKNKEKYSAKRNLKLIQKDGLVGLESKVDTIVIAGLGGETICDILFGRDLKFNINTKLILQPQTHLQKVREQITKNGFKIIDETPVYEKGLSYMVSYAVYDGSKSNITYVESILGDRKWMDKKDGIKYAKHLKSKYEKIALGIRKAKIKDEREDKYKLIIDELYKITKGD